MRVLIATPATSSLPPLVEAYRAAGWEVVMGAANVPLRAARFDIVHLHWPEALTDWRTPTDDDIRRIEDDLAWWRARSTIIGTVHNLAPHGRFESSRDRALFVKVYQACDVITHFSSFSRDELIRLYPPLSAARHLVHRPTLHTDLLPLAVGTAAARARFGVGDGDVLVAAFGSLRERAELELLERGVRFARVRGKRPILAVRAPMGRRQRLLRRLRALVPGTRWPAFASFTGLPTAEMVALCEAADVLVIPRYPPHLNSGVLQLAMTFGTPMVVPNYGVYAEYLPDSGCAFYPPNDARGLAEAIERLAAQDRDELVRRNRDAARDWGWPGNLAAILTEVARHGSRSPPGHPATP